MKLNPKLALLVLTLCLNTAYAHNEPHDGKDEHATQARVLGKLDFPTTTGSEKAQAAFEQGMLLLHLFEYSFAEEQFRIAQQIDPDFAMAYWGEAMVQNHPVWDQQNLEKGRAVLARLGSTPAARLEKTASQKERDYIQALEVLYGSGSKAERDRNYELHMAQMAQRYPDDHEIRLFHALAIMGTLGGERNVNRYMESGALSQSVFYANRQHPGAAHYFIHAVDDPTHAPLGMEAARALAIMAPDAGHSLHMTSHIFNALGMWDDVVIANQNAVRVSNKMAMEKGGKQRHWGHYNFWLIYGLLQQGRFNDARDLLTLAYEGVKNAAVKPEDRLILDPDNSNIGSVMQMWARYMIETDGADEVAGKWKLDMGDAYDPNLNYLYVRSMFASDPAVISANLETFRSLQTGLRKEIEAMPRQAPWDLFYLGRLKVIESELQAVLARAENDSEAMISHAVEASRLEGEMPYAFGPPFIDYPSAQLLGEMLLKLERYDEAADAFTLQLKRTRQRAQALAGLAEAERKRGNTEAADYALSRYREVRAKADS